MRTTSLIPVLTLGLFLLVHSASADEYYVDAVHGSDSAGDGSSSAPWKTISHSLSQIPGPSDNLHVRPGLYDAALGETFPLTPAAGVSLVSTDGPESTIIQGVAGKQVVRLEQWVVGSADPAVTGFTIRGGSDGVALGYSGLITGPTVNLTNDTIAGNSRYGVYTERGAGREILVVRDCSITGNRSGIVGRFTTYIQAWLIYDSDITGNDQHGLDFFVDSLIGGEFKVHGNRIENNGGTGLLLRADHGSLMQGTLLNNTISFNGGGGVYAKGIKRYNYWGYPYYGGVLVNHLANNTVYANGPPGGLVGVKSGGTPTSTVAWGNAVTDVNYNFDWCYYSNIGAGLMGGPGSFSLDPRFADAPAGDFRLLRNSPCIDTGYPNLLGIPPFDIEGDPRVLDGDGDGSARVDMGSDEFNTFVAPGAKATKGSPFHFFTQAPPAENGNRVVVLLSGGDGSSSGGIPIPGSGGRKIDLTPDTIFNLSLGLLPLFQTTLTSGEGTTTPFTIPANLPFTGKVYYAGVSIDLAGGQIVSITPTHSFVVQ